MGRRSEPGWRDRAARGLVLEEFELAEPAEHALVLLEAGSEITAALGRAGARIRHWSRRLRGDPAPEADVPFEVGPWPPGGVFDWIGLRLPKARAELLMLAHAAAARLTQEGRFWIWGAGDEGVQSAPGRLEGLFGRVETLAIGGRCRLLECREPRRESARGAMEDWREEAGPGSELPEGWVSWPGSFSHGRLDRGTRLLLEHLPRVVPESAVLDFACGTGPVARAILDACAAGGEGSRGNPAISVTGIDNDALSLPAFRENVPEAEAILSDGFGALGGRRFDWIVANPPYHVGKAGSRAVLEDLCGRAPEYLEMGGGLRLVVQGSHALDPLLSKRLGRIDVLAEEGGFRVWNATRTS